jgi:superfamily II DNA or RNA helicase
MSDIVRVEHLNAVHMKVLADPSIRQEIMNYFSFRPEGYQFSPKFKARVWDGWIRMYQPMRPVLYVGLFSHLKKFCEDRNYELEAPEDLMNDDPVPDDYGYEIAKTIGCKFEPRDYQNEYIVNALRNKRSLSLSPTSSGKSLIIYLLQQHYHYTFGHRTLIIVPTISLVHQMAGDFIDYGCDPKNIYKIQGGVDKNTSAPIVISTWQSLIKLNKEWFDQFRVVLGDEAHLFQAKSLTTILDKMDECYARHGFTGTLKSSETKTHRLVLEGSFGPVKRFVKTKDLMDQGTVADFNIKAIVLSHNNENRKNFLQAFRQIKEKSKRYPAEREYLINHTKRNAFIRNLVWSLKGQNNLILFDLVEKHGKVLEPLLRREDRVLHFIHGGVSGDERERIRNLIENDPNKQHDILASYGVFSTGVNLKRLDNVIFASGSKSEVKVLQSIGRSLRKGNGSDKATLYDITDDLTVGSFTNYTLEHFRKRIDIYSEEQFSFRIYNVDLN